MSEATPGERADELDNEMCHEILLRIVEIIDAHRSRRLWRSGRHQGKPPI